MQFVFSNSMFINHNLSFFRIPRQIPWKRPEVASVPAQKEAESRGSGGALHLQ
jgi:hypothetical protein